MAEKNNNPKIKTTAVKIPKNESGKKTKGIQEKSTSGTTEKKPSAKDTAKKSNNDTSRNAQNEKNSKKNKAVGSTSSSGNKANTALQNSGYVSSTLAEEKEKEKNVSKAKNKNDIPKSQAKNGQKKSSGYADKNGKNTDRDRNDSHELTAAQIRRHQFVPLFLILAAVFVVISYIVVEKSGFFGKIIQTVFYGIFGRGAFVIPVLLVIAAINWQKYVANRTIGLNMLLFVLTILLASSFLQLINLSMNNAASGDWAVNVVDLFKDGMDCLKQNNGGLVGGLIGVLLWNVFGSVGSYIVVVTVILVLVLSLFGATPVTVVTFIRYKIKVSQENKKARMELAAEQAKQREAEKTYSERRREAEAENERKAADQAKPKKKGLFGLMRGDDKSSDKPADETESTDRNKGEEKGTEENSGQHGMDLTKSVPDDKKQPQNVGTRPPVTIIKPGKNPSDSSYDGELENARTSGMADQTHFSHRENGTPTENITNDNGDCDSELLQNDLDVRGDSDAGTSGMSHTAVDGMQMEMGDAIPTEAPTSNRRNVKITIKREPTIEELANVSDVSDIVGDIIGNTPGDKSAPVAEKKAEPTESDNGSPALEVNVSNAGDISEVPLADSENDNKETANENSQNADDNILRDSDRYADYLFPPTELLAKNTSGNDGITDEEINENIDRLMDTLTSFKIRVQSITCACGPTITRYEVKPEPGVRVRSIANLVDDIALGLAKTGVRIEAPIPGKSAVGIEVPNDKKLTVYLRDLIENKNFTEMKSKLSACLGEDVGGRPIMFDIAKMPHLLIAGATGMGKSVCINSIIVSLLYKAKPDEVKLILIDPKKVEFSIYKDIPHLHVPIVTEPKKAAGALASAVAEMERRFTLMEDVGVRDIANYNRITKDDPDMEFMPQMVIIIDELADLMMTAPDDVESCICRITQKARAAGMHLIVGTQRPSVDVITGLIKANIPSRIAFTVASQVDSRTIIDIAGAEKLIGRGDMLYAPVGVSKPMRVQGSFVSESEVEAVVEFIKKHNGKAIYNDQFTKQIDKEAEKCGLGGKKSSAEASDDGEDIEGEDPKLREAIKIAVEDQKISTSLLQRKLSIGYGRAAKIIDRMQEMNIVSAPDGNKPRRILITLQQYREMYLNDDI